ncbi:MAG: phage tail protein, partial [Achromobacter ruhlandii]|nr:phage tail protein [Achromobacter ruhlandii]
MANTTVPIDPSGLIGIFKIDKDDLKDLKQAIGDSRKQSLADALAVFAGRAKSVVDFAENKIAQFEQGYFAAKLGGTSGRDMRALETVAQDFGVSVEAMRNSTQALHRNVRDDPKIAALLEQLHISSSDGAGAQRNSADLMLELSDALKRMDPAQARATGQGLGLDPG